MGSASCQAAKGELLDPGSRYPEALEVGKADGYDRYRAGNYDRKK